MNSLLTLALSQYRDFVRNLERRGLAKVPEGALTSRWYVSVAGHRVPLRVDCAVCGMTYPGPFAVLRARLHWTARGVREHLAGVR